jgi:hypothetical protein
VNKALPARFVARAPVGFNDSSIANAMVNFH